MPSLAIRFTPEVLTELRTRAAAEGVGVTQLVRGWTLERLQSEQVTTLPPDVGDALQVLIEHLRIPAKSARRNVDAPPRDAPPRLREAVGSPRRSVRRDRRAPSSLSGVEGSQTSESARDLLQRRATRPGRRRARRTVRGPCSSGSGVARDSTRPALIVTPFAALANPHKNRYRATPSDTAWPSNEISLDSGLSSIV